MKKIFILLVATVCLCGCGVPETNTPNRTNKDTGGINVTHQYHRGNAPQMQVVEIEGHAYIVVGPYNNPRIIHAEHCPCKNK